jgi:hypothetical protein
MAWRMNSHAPLLFLDPYSDCVANASMLHETNMDQNCRFYECDADHRNSLLQALPQSRVSYYILRLWIGIWFWRFFGKKCYDQDHEDIRSAFDFCTAAGRALCNGANDCERAGDRQGHLGQAASGSQISVSGQNRTPGSTNTFMTRISRPVPIEATRGSFRFVTG